jgi:hypothetical protein
MSCFYLFLASRNGGSSRDYPIGSPVYRTDPYRTSSAIPIPSSYVPRDQYTPSFSSVREDNYRTRDYGMDHHQSISNNSSRNSSNDYYSYRDRLNLKRSRPNFNDNEFVPPKRSMRR